MSQITDEVIRVLKPAPKPLTASDIYDAGSFESVQPVYVALATMAKDGRLIRSVPVDGGKYAYAINPAKRMNGDAVEIPEFVPPKDDAEGAPARKPKENRSMLNFLKPQSAPMAGSAVAAAVKHNHVSTISRPEIAAEMKAGEIVGITEAAKPVQSTDAPTGKVDPPKEWPVAAQPTEKDKADPPPAAIKELALSQDGIVGFEDTDPNHDPVELSIDCLFAAMVLRLPDKSVRWTKAQRESWLTMFNAAADFLYPESK